MPNPRPTEDVVQLRHPDPKRKMPRMAKGSYALARRTALAVAPKKPPGITLQEFLDEVATRLARNERWDRSASASWYAMAIKLDLEARGELERVGNKPPQRLVRV